jgi:hypothetical protein
MNVAFRAGLYALANLLAQSKVVLEVLCMDLLDAATFQSCKRVGAWPVVKKGFG